MAARFMLDAIQLGRPWGRRDASASGSAGDEGRDCGMTTAEYAIGTVAAAAFAGLLLKLLTSSTVAHLLESVITKAFSFMP